MKRMVFLIICAVLVQAAQAEVTTRVCRADGMTPLELANPNIPHIYRPIMEGTHLTIIISSDTGEDWAGELALWDANQDYGMLYGRDYNEEHFNWEGSVLPAAGFDATVWEVPGDVEVNEVIYNSYGFQFSAVADDSEPGDWFIVDYNAISTGNCSVIFWDLNIDWDHPQYQLSFTQVKTRDFDDDGIVNFKDFVIFGSNWRRVDCQAPDNCSGTDLDGDGNIDVNDLKLFTNFWLEETR
jgi:hypothetical protein